MAFKENLIQMKKINKMNVEHLKPHTNKTGIINACLKIKMVEIITSWFRLQALQLL